jgi:hypothetical protein
MGLHEIRKHRLSRGLERAPLVRVGQWRDRHRLTSVEADQGGVHQFPGFHCSRQCIHVTAGAFPDFGAGDGREYGLHVDAFGSEFEVEALGRKRTKALVAP